MISLKSLQMSFRFAGYEVTLKSVFLDLFKARNIHRGLLVFLLLLLRDFFFSLLHVSVNQFCIISQY